MFLLSSGTAKMELIDPRCRASIRTLIGPTLGPVHAGVRFHVPGPPSLTDLGC